VDPIDRELASLLSVEPSPEFRARVRARIASEPAPRSWYLQWRVVGVGVAGIAVAVVIVLGRAERPGNTQKSSSPSIARLPLPSSTLTAVPTTVPEPRAAATAVYRPSPRRQPEVLMAPNEVRGFRQLAALVREGRTHFVFGNEEAPAVLSEPATDIVIAPIAIAPIEVATNSEPVANSEGDEQ
jgi:hypothetical protein